MGDMYVTMSQTGAANLRENELGRKHVGESVWQATFGQYNPYIDWGQAQDKDGNLLYDNLMYTEFDPDWKLPSPEQWRADGLNQAMISQAVHDGHMGSQEAYDNLVQRVQWDRNQREVLEANNGFLNFAMAVPAFISNPINMPEIALGVMSGGTTFLSRMAIGAGVSSLTGFVDESLRQKYVGLKDEQLLANITAMSGIFGGFANGIFGRRAGDLKANKMPLLDDSTGPVLVPPGHALNKTDDILLFKDGKLTPFIGDVNEIPRGSRMGWSVTGVMNKSESPTARAVAARFDTSGTSTPVVGQTFMGDTVRYVKRQVQTMVNNEQRTIKNIYKSDFKKQKITEAEFNEMVYDAAARIANGEVIEGALGKAANSYIKGLRSLGEARKAAGLPSLPNYLTREWNAHSMLKLGRSGTVDMVVKAMRNKKTAKMLESEKGLKGKLAKAIKARDAMPKRTKLGTAERKAKDDINKEIKGLRKELRGLEFNEKDAIATANRLYDNVVKSGKADDFSLSDAMKQRTIDLNEADVLPLLNRNAGDILSRLAYRQTGRIATKKVLGFSSEEELNTAAKEFAEQVAAEAGEKEGKKMEQYFRAQVRHMWGTQMKSDLGPAAQMWKKGIMDMNYATTGGGFAVTAFMGETALPIVMGGLQVGLKSIGQTFKSLKNLYRGEAPAQEFMAQMQMMTHAFDNVNHSLMTRMANDLDDGYFATSRMNELLAKGGEFTSNKLGLSTVTESARIALGNAMLHDLFHNKALLKQLDVFNATGKMGPDLKKMTRLQFDVNRLAELRAMKDKVFKYNKDGSLKSYDLTVLDDELQSMIYRGLSNASDMNVLMGDKRHLPIWWSNPNNWALHMATQFMSYPLHAYESLLVRGMSEGNAAMVVGVMTAAMMSGLMTKAKEDAQIAMGMKDKSEARYDLETAEGMKHLVVRMLNTSSFLAPLSLGLNTMSNVMTGAPLGSEFYQSHWAGYFGGPTVSRVNDILKSLQSLDMNPFDENSNAWKTVYGRTLMMNSGLPLYTMPVVGDGLRWLNKEMAE